MRSDRCSRCREKNDRMGQRLCSVCHAAYQREHRRKLTRERRAVARFVAGYAKREGVIQPQACTVCGRVDSEMHHPDHEMDKLVVWLCRDHHMQWHEHWKRTVLNLFCEWLEVARACSLVGKKEVAERKQRERSETRSAA